jgi:hypothetical protein
LVGTQNVRNNASRIGGLDQIADNGTIVEAVESQPWSGEAKVHVSIANWIKTKDPKILPRVRRLWFKAVAVATSQKRQRGSARQHQLDMREVSFISSSLSDKVDVSRAALLSVNDAVVVCQGITPGHRGFVLWPEERAAMVKAAARNADVIHPYVVGDDLLSGVGAAPRFIIDFGGSDMLSAQSYGKPFQHLRDQVLPTVNKVVAEAKSERATSIEQWWLHWRSRAELLAKVATLPRYLACSRVTKRPLFAFVNSSARPGDALQVFALADDFSFGVLQSSAHYFWFHAKCSNMKSDPRYTSESVFRTFPWPQNPSNAQVEAVAAAAVALRGVRARATANATGGLRALYATMELPGKNPLRDAHAALDSAVFAAYGFSGRKDILQQLLDLNMNCAAGAEAGLTPMGPGIPRSYSGGKNLITEDCFGV